ncbi:hypothetical protein BOTBODRAFT_143467 [Botryobasidium botryosum FD-172 SS1]|uniref:Uncharacterized protein n=1 Tax=Botryobasidium botryosum (strain FD-172 SS1) TaxID=930990 RepID=A0A067MSD4_BOTB1|nr:hypothetical protein BOTBODRAFT_143467 [Botryobasidium botryosum FD-172 SS1]
MTEEPGTLLSHGEVTGIVVCPAIGLCGFLGERIDGLGAFQYIRIQKRDADPAGACHWQRPIAQIKDTTQPSKTENRDPAGDCGLNRVDTNAVNLSPQHPDAGTLNEQLSWIQICESAVLAVGLNGIGDFGWRSANGSFHFICAVTESRSTAISLGRCWRLATGISVAGVTYLSLPAGGWQLAPLRVGPEYRGSLNGALGSSSRLAADGIRISHVARILDGHDIYPCYATVYSKYARRGYCDSKRWQVNQSRFTTRCWPSRLATYSPAPTPPQPIYRQLIQGPSPRTFLPQDFPRTRQRRDRAVGQLHAPATGHNPQQT